MSTEHLDYLPNVVRELETMVFQKESKYDGSWKARGGVGAYFVSVRKFDALENMVKAHGYNVFAELGQSGDGTIEDTLRDIVGYGMLILAERRRLRVMQGGTPEDGGQHGKQRDTGEITDRSRTPDSSGLGKGGYSVGMSHPSTEDVSERHLMPRGYR